MAEISSVRVYYSTSVKFPKWHLTVDCEGLEAVDKDPEAGALAVGEYDDFHVLGRDHSGRPCRMCALETTLTTVFADLPDDRRVFTTFTSQGNPRETLPRFKWQAHTESGVERLTRLAATLDLELAPTPSGPAAYGMLPEGGISILARNLRTWSNPDVAEPPTGPVITCLWALLNDNPPELAAAHLPSVNDDVDPWQVASLLLA